MEIPSKIYIRPSDSSDCPSGCGVGNLITAHTKRSDGDIEYTNLSDVWRNINKSTPIVNGVAFEYPIIVYAKLQGVLKVGIVITPEELSNIVRLLASKFDKVLWAYVRDLVPGAKGKGE